MTKRGIFMQTVICNYHSGQKLGRFII